MELEKIAEIIISLLEDQWGVEIEYRIEKDEKNQKTA